MKRIITIAGKLGSGKSSTAKRIAKELGFRHFSSGDFLRKIAEERGMTIKELMIAAESDPQIDRDIDHLLKGMSGEHDLIIDSRLAFYWIPESYKIYLDIQPEVAAQRMFDDLKKNEDRRRSEDSLSLEDMRGNMLERHESDVRRYKRLYDINHTDHDHFDLVIDTGRAENDLDTVVNKILDGYKEFLKGKNL